MGRVLKQFADKIVGGNFIDESLKNVLRPAMRKNEVADEIADRLVIDAAACGVSLRDHVAQMIRMDGLRPPETFDDELDRLPPEAEVRDGLLLPTEFSRADIYQDHP